MAKSKSGEIHSMTGFARAEGADARYRWTWELKSVNARNLDLRFRLPPGHDHIEAKARADITQRFTRGNVSVQLRLERGNQATRMRVDRETLSDMMALVEELAADADVSPSPAAALLSLPGVLQPVDDEEGEDAAAARTTAMIATLGAALDQLAGARGGEGKRLAAVVADHLAEIAALCAEARGLAAAQPGALRQRLEEQLASLLDGETRVAEDRLAQEVALLAAKADIREELDRLDAHVEAARALIAEAGAVGRRLDFLCQEFNREANTLCSKSPDLELTRVGLDLKAAVERLREQIQNIE